MGSREGPGPSLNRGGSLGRTELRGLARCTDVQCVARSQRAPAGSEVKECGQELYTRLSPSHGGHGPAGSPGGWASAEVGLRTGEMQGRTQCRPLTPRVL